MTANALSFMSATALSPALEKVLFPQYHSNAMFAGEAKETRYFQVVTAEKAETFPTHLVLHFHHAEEEKAYLFHVIGFDNSDGSCESYIRNPYDIDRGYSPATLREEAERRDRVTLGFAQYMNAALRDTGWRVNTIDTVDVLDWKVSDDGHSTHTRQIKRMTVHKQIWEEAVARNAACLLDL